MNHSVSKIVLLLLILTMVGVASGLSEGNKENPNKTLLDVNESESQPAVEPLIQALGADDVDSRKEARFSLEEMGENAVDPLIEIIDSGIPEPRFEAVLALGNIGGQKAEKALIRLLKDENPEVRSSAALALGNARSERAEKELIQALSDEDRRVRSNSAWALGEIAKTGSSSKEDDWEGSLFSGSVENKKLLRPSAWLSKIITVG
ncbi:MAG: HEAT repeat domain-containing protein [Methanosarcina barkeri]|nr:HEAT repeat domain-containing protein [Methanosarcina sp. ERenArc_MAG2]